MSYQRIDRGPMHAWRCDHDGCEVTAEAPGLPVGWQVANQRATNVEHHFCPAHHRGYAKGWRLSVHEPAHEERRP